MIFDRQNRKHKEQKKMENWHTKICDKIAKEPNFPKDEIIDMYLCNDNGYFSGTLTEMDIINHIFFLYMIDLIQLFLSVYYCVCDSFYIYITLFTANDGPQISWERPNMDLLVDFLNFHQNWDPSYIRRIMFPMLSTIFLREMATTPTDSLLFGQFEFDSLKRVKTRYGYQFYVVKWKRAMGNIASRTPANKSDMQEDVIELDVDETVDLLDDCDFPQICEEDGCSFLLTDENMDLVGAAYPEEVKRFRQEQVFIISYLAYGLSTIIHFCWL